jgi:hypothetical protein
MLRRLYGGEEVEVPPELEESYRAVLAPLGIRAGIPEEPQLPL